MIGRVRVQVQEQEQAELSHAELDRLYLALLPKAERNLLHRPQPERTNRSTPDTHHATIPGQKNVRKTDVMLKGVQQ